MPQPVQLRLLRVNHRQKAVPIRQQNILPHFRVAAGNAREIAKTAAGKIQIPRALRVVEHLVDVTERQQMRKVRHGGKNRVVLGRVHRMDFRTHAAPHVFHQVQAACILPLVRADNQFFALIQAELCRQRAAPVRTGNGMGGNAARKMLRQILRKSRQGRLLGTAHIAHHRVRRQMRQKQPAQ